MKRAPIASSVLVCFVGAIAGCGSNDGANPDSRCQPITPAPGCFLPFPSTYYEAKDATSATGYRVSIPVGVLPKNQVGADFNPTRWNLFDGWSPSSQLIADLGARIDPANLPAQTDLAASITPQSTVQLLAYDTGERVPLFAEVDANAKPDETQVLLIHPMVRLRSNTRYVVALIGLRAGDGRAIAVAPFQSLVTGRVDSGSTLQSVRSRYQEIFAFLEKQSLPRTSLTYAWDFVTTSEPQTSGNLLSMRDAAFKRWEKDKLGFKVTSSTDNPDTHLARRVLGTFQVPSFLTSNTELAAGMNLDPKGHPVDTGTNYDAKLHINVPNCAMTAPGPVPILVFGHGLFGSASEINSGFNQEMIDTRLCVVEVATDWVGFSDADATVEVSLAFGSFDRFWLLGDRSQQGMLNMLMLARVAARRLKDMPELAFNGKPAVDGREVYYYGISQGGDLGGTVVALSPEISHGALNVGGGPYTYLVWRSTDFKTFKAVFNLTYPISVDQQVLWALTQNYWDLFEEIGFVKRALTDGFPDENGMPMAKKQLLLQESKNDAQVPNQGSRIVARTAGMPLLAPANETVFGIDAKPAPLASAYTQWNGHPNSAPGDNNVPPMDDNCAHEAIRRIPELQLQLKAFFKPDGQVTQTCNAGQGPCDFPHAPGCQ